MFNLISLNVPKLSLIIYLIYIKTFDSLFTFNKEQIDLLIYKLLDNKKK